MKRVYSQYRITGFNLDNLINYVKKRGITLVNVKKFQQNVMIVCVKHSESEKFFAIAKELCYNIKKIKDKGAFYPFLYLYKNIGLVIGSVILLVISIFANDFIFKIDFKGTGSVLKREIELCLQENGVTEFSRFSNLDVDELSRKLLSSNQRLTFVECRKEGNVLVVNSALASGSKDKLNGNAKELVSDVDGVVEELKIYRGSALVSVGDEIKKGQTLVDGHVTVKDQELEVNVLAVAYIKSKETYQHSSSRLLDKDSILAVYEEEFDDGEIIESKVNYFPTGKGYQYIVEIYYRRIIMVG